MVIVEYRQIRLSICCFCESQFYRHALWLIRSSRFQLISRESNGLCHQRIRINLVGCPSSRMSKLLFEYVPRHIGRQDWEWNFLPYSPSINQYYTNCSWRGSSLYLHYIVTLTFSRHQGRARAARSIRPKNCQQCTSCIVSWRMARWWLVHIVSQVPSWDPAQYLTTSVISPEDRGDRIRWELCL